MAGVLSYQDLDSYGPPAEPKRVLYRAVNHEDDEFDAIMAQRRKEAGDADDAMAGTEEVKKEEEVVVGFGTAAGAEVDDELLRDLPVPPLPQLYRGFARDLRPSAIFLTSRLFGLLPTNSILRWASSHLQSSGIRSEGLEWISDWSLVLVFSSQDVAMRAFEKLLLHPDEIEGENGVPEAFQYLMDPDTADDVLEAAGEFILTHRPAKPLPPSIFTKAPFPSDTPPQDQLPFARFALVTDVKNVNARQQSFWYAVHGERAGKEREAVSMVPTFMQDGGKRKRRGSDEEDQSRAPGSRGEARPIRGLPRRAGRTDAQRQAELDDELDRFMRGGQAAEEAPPAENGDADDDEDDGRRKKRRASPSPRADIPELLPKDEPETSFRADTLESRIRDSKPTNGEGDIVEEEVEVIDEDTGEKVKRKSRRRRKAGERTGGKEAWGSLFSRLT